MKVMWIHQKMLGSPLQMRRKLYTQRFHGKKLALHHLVTPPAIDLSQNQALKAAQGELDLIKNYPRKGQQFLQVLEMYIRDIHILGQHIQDFFVLAYYVSINTVLNVRKKWSFSEPTHPSPTNRKAGFKVWIDFLNNYLKKKKSA